MKIINGEHLKNRITELKTKYEGRVFSDFAVLVSSFIDTEPEVVVHCKDCEYRGNVDKCVLAAVAKKSDYPLFLLDKSGEWFCADGK